MANLGISFDPSAVEPDAGRDRDLLPEGEFTLHVIESDVVANSKGTGLMLKLTFEVFDGPFEKRRVWENFNIQNTNAQAQQIAQKQLSALCHAIGLLTVLEDSQDLHYQPFRAKVGIEKARPKPDGGEFPPRNKVTRFIPLGETAPPTSKPAVRPAPVQQPRAAAPAPQQRTAAPASTRPAATGTRPWDRPAA